MANEVMEFALTNDPGEVVAALNAAFDGITQTGLKAESANTAANLVSTTDQDVGDVNLRAKTLQSDVTTGTAPLMVASTTKVLNLNSDSLDGYDWDTRFQLSGTYIEQTTLAGGVGFRLFETRINIPSGKQLKLKRARYSFEAGNVIKLKVEFLPGNSAWLSAGAEYGNDVTPNYSLSSTSGVGVLRISFLNDSAFSQTLRYYDGYWIDLSIENV